MSPKPSPVTAAVRQFLFELVFAREKAR